MKRSIPARLTLFTFLLAIVPCLVSAAEPQPTPTPAAAVKAKKKLGGGSFGRWGLSGWRFGGRRFGGRGLSWGRRGRRSAGAYQKAGDEHKAQQDRKAFHRLISSCGDRENG